MIPSLNDAVETLDFSFPEQYRKASAVVIYKHLIKSYPDIFAKNCVLFYDRASVLFSAQAEIKIGQEVLFESIKGVLNRCRKLLFWLFRRNSCNPSACWQTWVKVQREFVWLLKRLLMASRLVLLNTISVSTHSFPVIYVPGDFKRSSKGCKCTGHWTRQKHSRGFKSCYVTKRVFGNVRFVLYLFIFCFFFLYMHE